MATLYDKDGNEVEALTEEEQKEFAEKAIEDFKAENPDIANLEQLKADLKAKEDELKGLKDTNSDKSKNIEGQRKTIEEKEKEIEDLKKKMDSAVVEVKDFVVKRTVNEYIKRASGGDVELEKKIKHHFEKTLGAMAGETEDEIATKITAALKLSDAGAAAPNVFDNTAGSGGAGGGNNKNDANKPSSELMEFGKRFGLTEDDWKKAGGRK